MKILPADTGFLADQYQELTEPLLKAWDEADAEDDATALPLLHAAMLQLVAVLRSLESESDELEHNPDVLESHELTTLGEYGTQLLMETAAWARRYRHEDIAHEVEALVLPLALVIARHEGELKEVQPLVHQLALLANQLQTPAELTQLYRIIDEVLDAMNPAFSESYEVDPDPANPWRLLLLNRAIVATRTHNTRLMEPAFDAIVELLPGDCDSFFEEAMEQMELIDYPEEVREMVKSYYLQHHIKGRTLH